MSDGPSQEPMRHRVLGVPMLFAISYSAVGFSLYFALGVVADRGLGLTPLIFLGAGLMFVLATMSYSEGGSMFVQRGGASNLARHAFNELVSFVAGWALLIDFILVIALAAVSVPHYLTPIWAGFGHGTGEVATAIGVVAVVAAANVMGATGLRHRRLVVGLAIADMAVLVLLMGIGAAVAFDPELLTQNLDLFNAPTLEDTVYALVVATVAFAGIEAAANLAPDIRWEGRDLRRSVVSGGLLLPIIYAGLAAVALMVVPVTAGPGGPSTELGGAFIEEPVLGIAQSLEPAWASILMEAAIVAIAPLVLVWAASTGMLALTRHVYTLATNRQIPSWLGKLGSRRPTPHVAIGIAAVIAAALVIPGDVEMLAGIYAFGATLAIAIAHLSVLRLRATRPELERPYRVPLNVRLRGIDVPVPAVAGAIVTALAWLSVIAFHEEARWAGGGWMLFGLVAYVVYRRLVEGTSLTERVEVPERALVKASVQAEYEVILVPVFGTPLDDDIVSTAGRLADAALVPGKHPPVVELVYVIDLPLTVPLDSRPPPERTQVADAALHRAHEIADEYETVEVKMHMVRARDAGAGIVQAARESGAELIVMGAEPPTRIRGGAVLGGIGGSRPAEVGPVTEHVLRRAPCRVLLTAPAEEVVAAAQEEAESEVSGAVQAATRE